MMGNTKTTQKTETSKNGAIRKTTTTTTTNSSSYQQSTTESRTYQQSTVSASSVFRSNINGGTTDLNFTNSTGIRSLHNDASPFERYRNIHNGPSGTYPALRQSSQPISSSFMKPESRPQFALPSTTKMSSLTPLSKEPSHQPADVRLNQNPRYEFKYKRSYALIFNNEEFNVKSMNRDGSRADEIKLCEIFKQYKVTYDVHRNRTVSQIKSIIRTTERKNFKNYDFLIVTILSHGNEGELIHAKDGYYYLSDDVIEPIIRNNTLIGKPKIFIIQACRGSITSIGIQPDAHPHNFDKSKPSESDILKLYSTYEKRVSFRDTTEGSFFIQTLCNHLAEKGKVEDLEKIMKTVCREITQKMPPNYKQTPTTVSTLTKDFYISCD